MKGECTYKTAYVCEHDTYSHCMGNKIQIFTS